MGLIVIILGTAFLIWLSKRLVRKWTEDMPEDFGKEEGSKVNRSFFIDFSHHGK